jgi:hypothetical protein
VCDAARKPPGEMKLRCPAGCSILCSLLAVAGLLLASTALLVAVANQHIRPVSHCPEHDGQSQHCMIVNEESHILLGCSFSNNREYPMPVLPSTRVLIIRAVAVN